MQLLAELALVFLSLRPFATKNTTNMNSVAERLIRVSPGNVIGGLPALGVFLCRNVKMMCERSTAKLCNFDTSRCR
jgi:hypothetical protein